MTDESQVTDSGSTGHHAGTMTEPLSVPYRERERSVTMEPMGEEHDELLTINIGPHHPATHGVLRLLTTLEGEIVRDGEPVPSVVDLFPTADFQEREVYDMFGFTFEGHPDMRRILMPEDYQGWPQRRDFPMGGEPVLFTFNEHKLPRWYE